MKERTWTSSNRYVTRALPPGICTKRCKRPWAAEASRASRAIWWEGRSWWDSPSEVPITWTGFIRTRYEQDIHASEWFQPPFVFDLHRLLLFCGNFGIMFADCAPCTSGFAVQKGKALLVSWVSGNWMFWTQLLHDPVLQVVDPDPQIWCGWTLAKITRLAKPCQNLAYAQKEAVANKAAFKTLRKIVLFRKACTTWDSSKRRLQFIRPSESIHLPHRINAHLHSRTRLLKPATIFTTPWHSAHGECYRWWQCAVLGSLIAHGHGPSAATIKRFSS